MKMLVECVKAFHDKMSIAPTQRLASIENEELVSLGKKLLKESKKLELKVDDPDARYLRAHLDVEEDGEWLVAIGSGDEVEALDALADRLYVLIGCAVQFDLPIIEAFAEVHLSNMSKQPMDTDPSKARVRDKGPNYRPPNIKEVLERYRSRSTLSAPGPQNTLQALHRSLDAMRMRETPLINNVDKLTAAQRAQLQMLVNGITNPAASEFIQLRLDEIAEYIQTE